ncbi:MAG: hypothetical protein A2632_01525 [Candidatus Pacebacteria bacterium RIFCSPHIGHO2_01_FULL_46_16]|nr:MAG: hypothetical protein A2632_01525 [Candidatus Pacebacteria bacterium RIFCSPHIGHO2_01_FULL_46_16]OGJ37727.1 MAG: hypothetical protein A3A82_00935 [Candidatus Pacebacteria bacterium RIFCSPLOWO2_01_FULL_47_12]
MPVTKNTSSLSRATMIGRAVVKWGIISLVVMIVGRVLITSLVAFWKAMNPPKPEPPTVGFGILPSIVFDKTLSKSPTSYSLELPTGNFPLFSDRAKVYLYSQATPSLLADQAAKEIANRYNFVFAPEVVSDTVYRWTKSLPLVSTFEMDINTHQFQFTTDFMNRPELLAKPNLPDGFQAVQIIKQFLGSANLLSDDVATSSGDITYQKLIGRTLQPAVSVSDAEFIEVNINRAPIDDLYPMYSPQKDRGTIHAIIAGGLSGADSVVQMEYNYFPTFSSLTHTYPLRSIASAWEVLQAGEGYVVPEFSGQKAVIRTVSLGYFDDFKFQPYLQPIYVFEGDDHFVGYVPAITPEFAQRPQP